MARSKIVHKRALIVKKLTAPLKKRLVDAHKELTAYGALDQTRKREFPAHFYDWDGARVEDARLLLGEWLCLRKRPSKSGLDKVAERTREFLEKTS